MPSSLPLGGRRAALSPSARRRRCRRRRARARAASPPDSTVTAWPAAAFGEPCDEIGLAVPRSTPSESQTTSMPGVRREKARDGRQRLGALDRVRARAEAAPAARARRPAAPARHRAGLRQRHQRDAAAVGLGAGDHVVAGAHAARPRWRRRRQPSSISSISGRAGVAVATGRIPQRAGGGEDHERREQQPQQRQPPRRARRRLFLRRDVEQQPRRRKLDRAAAAAESAAAATTAPAGSAGRAGPAAERRRAAGRIMRPSGPAPTARAAALPSPMRACSASSSSLAGRSVRWMAKLQPSRSVSARMAARCRATRRLVIGAPVLGAAGGDRAAALRLDEFDAAGIGEGLLGRIDDLHQVALRAAGRELRDRRADLVDRAPQVGQHHDLGERRRARSRAAGWRARSRSCMQRLGHAVDHLAAAGRPHQAGHADALAAVDQHLGEREGRRPARGRACFRRASRRARTPSRASGRARSRPCARPPIPARAHRDGRRAPSGASRCGGSPRPERSGGTARNSRRSRRGGGRAGRGSRWRRRGAPPGPGAAWRAASARACAAGALRGLLLVATAWVRSARHSGSIRSAT